MSLFGIFGSKVGHPALYNDLCKLHDLDKKTRSVLDLLVQQLDLKQPGMLFIDSSYFIRAIQMPAFKEHERTLRELCFKWFGRRI